jgi:hypothetical protein
MNDEDKIKRLPVRFIPFFVSNLLKGDAMLAVRWKFFLERGVKNIQGIVFVDDDATDEDITEIVESRVAEILPSRTTWEKQPVTGQNMVAKPVRHDKET